ncbi:MAG TPA: bifunctional nicotinamidase/pyrazinamidase [Burkholderiales bacterium]|jgi:nicotinamidase/pyrazinamidase|nr:bifunctional nicotinamidase/pyrazinamidase [Burkholderiales bacterium]
MPRPTDCLIVVDVQNDFCPGGALEVQRGDEIVPLVNRLAREFENIVVTQDWHPAGHASFASSHSGRKPFETTRLRYGKQVLWPDHCIQGTRGAALHDGLDLPRAQLVIRKGWHQKVDSYSAFLEADRKTKTGLDGYLRSRGVKRVYCVGLATDFCVAWTALDARRFRFQAVVIEDACRAIDNAGSLAAALKAMGDAGVKRAPSASLLAGRG